MRHRQVATVALGLALAWTAAGAAQQTAESLYQAALYQEEVRGELQQAVALYQRILTTYRANRVVGAKAQLHIGRCYETLGMREAQRAYQRVVDNFADQTEAVGQARARLAALQTPAPAVAGRGPVARRLLTNEDTHGLNFFTMTPSPDGRRVAYLALGAGVGADGETRLFLRDLASGAEEQLLPGLPTAVNWSPVWSPDGRRLAFVERAGGASVESIKTLDLASRTVTAIPGTEVPASGRALPTIALQSWSRDGRFITYLYSPPGGTRELGTVPVEGGSRRVLADGASAGGPLSPDGRHVAYMVGEKGSEQVFVQAVGGGPPRQITSEPGGNRSPVWSPDGSAIAYLRRDGIWLVPVANGDATGAPRLAYSSQTPFVWRSLVWTAAGGLYLVTSSDEGVPHRIAVDPATGAFTGAVGQLPSYSVPGGGRVGNFKWSPDMQHTAFATGFGDLVISGANGASMASHTVAPYETLFVLSWSGDGREVFCRYFTSRAGGVVSALDVASGRIREIAPWIGRQRVRSVSADGGRILYMYGQDQDEATPDGLVVVEAGRPGGRLVAPTWDADSLPLKGPEMERISPQGDRVAFARSARRGSSDGESLWVVGSDGTGLRRIATIKEIGHVLWDPSGRFVAYTGRADSATVVLRIVEVETGVERGSTRLPSELWGKFELSDWSRDGRFIGFVAWEERTEYWVVQGLVEGGR